MIHVSSDGGIYTIHNWKESTVSLYRYACYFIFCLIFLIFSLIFANAQQVCGILEVTVHPSRLEEQVPWGKSIDLSSIQPMQQSSVTETLKQIPGVTVNSFGSYAPQSYIKLRGANTEHTQVRLLGVDVNDSSGGGRFDFSNIFAEDAQSLTVRTSSDLSAIGGTVDIEPRKGWGKPEATAFTEGGSYQTGRTRAELSGSTARQHYFISGNLLKTGTGKLKNHLHGNTVSDRHLSENLNARLGHQVNEVWGTDLYLSQSQSQFDINRFMNGLPFKSVDHGTHQQGIVILKNHLQTLGNRWDHDLILNSLNHRNDASIYSQNYTNQNYSVGAIYNTKIKIHEHHQMMTSLGVTRDRVKLSTSGEHRIKSENGELTYRTDAISRLIFEMKGRFDRHDFFKTHRTYLTHAKYYIVPDLTIFSSYGTSFRTPTAFDFYSSGPLSVGNSNLKPMTSRNFEMGSEMIPFKDISLMLTYFRLDINNLLATITTPGGKFQRINTSRLTEGLETFIRFRLDHDVQVHASYTLTKAIDKETQRSSIRLSRHQVSAGIQTTYFKNTTLFAEGFYRSSSPDHSFLDNRQQRVRLPSSFTVRLGGAYGLNDHTEINVRIENLLNDHNEEIYGFPNRGMSILIGAKIKT